MGAPEDKGGEVHQPVLDAADKQIQGTCENDACSLTLA
jgi:hypothetical protein